MTTSMRLGARVTVAHRGGAAALVSSFFGATVVALLIVSAAGRLHAQSTSAGAASEEIEPRIIGTTGTTMIGLAGYADRFFSSEDTLATNYTAQIDVGRFLTRALVVRGGVAGTGQIGGDDPEDRPTGSGAASLHAFGGVLFYFTPQSMVSLYSGAEYWEQLTQRGDRGTGSLVGKLGLQGAVSARASFFIDGGYGVRLSRGDEGELLSRVTGRIGLSFKF